jgi:hypothetical protein
MAAIPITKHRRYRVGKLKMVLCRYSGGTAGTSNSTVATETRFTRLYAALVSAHVVNQASQPGHRVNINAGGGGGAAPLVPGALGVAATASATGSYLMIGR